MLGILDPEKDVGAPRLDRSEIGNAARCVATRESNRNGGAEKHRRKEIHKEGELPDAGKGVERELQRKEGVANVCEEMR